MLHPSAPARRRAALAAALIVAGLEATGLGAAPQRPTPPADSAAYVVHASTYRGASAAVSAVGGTMLRGVPGLGDAIARLTPAEAATLGSRHGLMVEADGKVSMTETSGTPGPPDSVFPEVTGASKLVAAGDDGAGVTVAVLDTGIDASLPDFGGRVIAGVDLTGQDAPFDDAYGHGTFVAGLIASSGASSGGRYVGEAPGADLVSIKVAGANGVTSIGTIISGIAWAISHRVADDIRVLNLSLGAVPETPSALDPLDEAVEQAWRAGIVVVTTAGNAGPTNGTITSPGNDPLVITAGAISDNGSLDPSEFTVPSFTGVGPTRFDGWLKPDVAAPGESVVSLAAPGSTVVAENPGAEIGSSNFEGSGTSFAAAIVSGEVALMLSADPSLTPDAVKSRLLLTTTPGPVGNPFVDGHGITNVDAAVTEANVPTINQAPAAIAEALSPVTDPLSRLVPLVNSWSVSTWNPADYSGTPPADEGWNLLALPVLTPAVTGAAWNGAAWNGAAWNGAAWNEASWNEASWNGAAWNGAAWNGAA